MRKLNNFNIKFISSLNVTYYTTTFYSTFIKSILYYKYFFSILKLDFALLDKFITWNANITLLPSYLTFLKFKFIFFKRSKSITDTKLTYEWIPVIPNDYDLPHYLNMHVRNILQFYYKFVVYGFIKLVLLYSFWPTIFTKNLN